MKTVLTWVVLILIVLWLINDPANAVVLAHKIEHAAGVLAGAL